MRLWNPDDPHGIATARRALLWFAFAIVFIGGNRVVFKGNPVEPFLWMIGGLVAIALLMEPVLGLVRSDSGRKGGT